MYIPWLCEKSGAIATRSYGRTDKIELSSEVLYQLIFLAFEKGTVLL